jgi:subtilase family serine protease
MTLNADLEERKGVKTGRYLASLAAISVLAACGGGGGGQAVVPPQTGAAQVASTTRAGAGASANYQSVCSDRTPDEATCHALVRTDIDGGVFSPTHDAAQAEAATPSGYGPTQLRAAYNLTSLSQSGGSGQTVALVEVGDYKTAEHDLSVYRSKYGIPACTTANGCFNKVGQNGTSTLPAPYPGWAQETALDMDMVSAICPNCHILIVEADRAGTNADLNAAENTAARLGANEISNSYGGPEGGASNAAYDHPGIIITASSGDSGPGVSQPCSYASVVCTGGTTLRQATNARGWTETIWSSAGGGCSAIVAKPSWQSSYTQCTRRVSPDNAFDANPNTGVAVYDSTPAGGSSGWMVFGGTSVASPAISSVYALAGNAASLDAAQSIWQNAGMATLYEIGGAYSTYAGWGTPDGTGAF